MKVVIIALAILGSASSAFATAECHPGSKKQYACTSTPQEDDSIPAEDMFETIAVCVDDQNASSLVAEKKGIPESSPVEVVTRPGGVSYTISLMEVSVSLNVPTGLSPQVTQVRGSFVRDFAGHGSETAAYTCDIVQ